MLERLILKYVLLSFVQLFHASIVIIGLLHNLCMHVCFLLLFPFVMSIYTLLCCYVIIILLCNSICIVLMCRGKIDFALC